MRDDADPPADDAAFPFPALAAQAGRAADRARDAAHVASRDAALAAFMAARLAADFLLPRRASPRARAERTAGARRWLAALTLPAAARIPLARLADASAGRIASAAVIPLTDAIAALRPLLDDAAAAELDAVLARLRAAS